jgi:hypothetical protein
MFEALTISGGIALAIGICITVTILNHRSAENIETETRGLIQRKEREIIDHDILRIAHALPRRARELDKEKRNEILYPITAYRRADALHEDVLRIRDRTSKALILLPLSVFATLASGWLWDSGSSLFPLSATAAVLPFVVGFAYGVYSGYTIREVEKINTRLSEASTIKELSRIITDALNRHFGYALEEQT